MELIEAAKSGDTSTIERLLSSGANVNMQDEHGWTPLHWAAGKGLTQIVALLLKRGADASLPAKDTRTPLLVAKAAARPEVVALLIEENRTQGEASLGASKERLYCKAFSLGRLRQFRGWSEQVRPGQPHDNLPDNHIVYLHQDFSVTESISRGESVILDNITPNWKEFCEATLNFTIPEDLL